MKPGDLSFPIMFIAGAVFGAALAYNVARWLVGPGA